MAGSDCHRNSVGLVPHVALLYPTLSGSLTLGCNGQPNLGQGVFPCFPCGFFPVIFAPQKISTEDANVPPKRRSVVDCGWLSGCGQGPVFFFKAAGRTACWRCCGCLLVYIYIYDDFPTDPQLTFISYMYTLYILGIYHKKIHIYIYISQIYMYIYIYYDMYVCNKHIEQRCVYIYIHIHTCTYMYNIYIYTYI